MQEYYARRADEYEKIYRRDEATRQAEQNQITTAIAQTLRERSVLEVAAGTGYWTQFVAQVAARIVATDINQEVLEIARQTKILPNTELVQADAFMLPFKVSSFTGGLANFWFSHLKKDQRDKFFRHFHSKLQPGATIFVADNVYNEGVGGEIVTVPEDADNTYKLRTLEDGSAYLIIKNYPSTEELVQQFSQYDSKFSESSMHYGRHFWYVAYTLR